jgi:glycerophosphoryl diester phosphodiesterase
MKPSSNPLRATGGLPSSVFNIAHRGARAFAPENTLAAFAKARDFGCPMFEMDVHKSRDGELIVHHDDTLLRCTDAETKFAGRSPYFVSDFTFDELMSLDAGSWYIEQLALRPQERQPFLQTLSDAEIAEFVSAKDREYYRSGAIRLPTLRKTLELAKSTGMMVNIELKTLPRMYAELAEDVVKLVQAMDMELRVLISSFDHEQLLMVRRLSAVIATGALTSDRLAKPADYLRLLDADAYNPGCYSDYDSMGFGSVTGKLDPGGIHSVRQAGRGVNVWTCNDKAQMRQLIKAGVTGLITDFPNRVRDVLAGH